MENDGEYDEDGEHAPVQRCAHCGHPMLSKRRGAIYCGRRCKELARAKRQRDHARVTTLRAKYPQADLSLMELHERATPPVPRAALHDVDEVDEDVDEPYPGDDGAYLGVPGQGTGNSTWDQFQQLSSAEDAIRRRYARLMAPYEAQLRHNIGVRPTALVDLERARDRELRALHREHDHQAEVSRASRNEPRRVAEAHERQMERAVLRELSQDLRGGSRRSETPSPGRATGDIWNW